MITKDASIAGAALAARASCSSAPASVGQGCAAAPAVARRARRSPWTTRGAARRTRRARCRALAAASFTRSPRNAFVLDAQRGMLVPGRQGADLGRVVRPPGSVRLLADVVAGRIVVAHPELPRALTERIVGRAVGHAAAELRAVPPDNLRVVA